MAFKEKPDFEKDNEIGKIGENLLKKILSSSPKTKRVIDVSNEYVFQLIDVDFVQITEDSLNGSPYTMEDVKRNLIGKWRKNSFFVLYEVKTDTVSFTSRNVVYEFISHDKSGCAANSRADYFFYVFIDENLEIKEAWLITVKKWREYIRENHNNQVRMKDLHKGGIALNEFNKFDDKVLNVLTNIDVMEKEKIAIKIDLEKYA